MTRSRLVSLSSRETRKALLGAALLASFCAACSSTPTSNDPVLETDLGSAATDPDAAVEDYVPPPLAPWTEAFGDSAMLLANRVTIEGPVGLLDHFVMRGDDEMFERVTKVTEDGFVQILRPYPEVFDPAKAHLDRWNINAMQELRATENPNATEVTVIAEGDVIWRSTDGASQSGNRVTFTGVIVLPEDPITTPTLLPEGAASDMQATTQTATTPSGAPTDQPIDAALDREAPVGLGGL